MRYIILTEEEKQGLEDLRKSSTSFVIRRRCECLLLSAEGNSIAMVCAQINVGRQTLRRLFDKWDSANVADKFSALHSAKGKGAKIKLQPVAELLPYLVEKYSRNLKPILDVLEKEHSIKVSKPTLQSFLKGAGL